jgi:hypothetical protein
MNVCVKGVKPETWRYLKSEAAKADKNMGEYIEIIAMKEKERPKSNWDTILNWKPILTKKEAEEMEKEIYKAFRTETEFR